MARAAGLAAACAMLGSAIELSVLAIKSAGSRNSAYQGLDVIWANPLATLVLVVPVSLILWRLSERLFLAWLAFNLVAPSLMVLRPGSRLPLIILSAGIAAQLGAYVVRRGQAVILRAGVAIAALLTVLAAGTQGSRIVRERRAAGGEPPAGAPNVLLVILDTVRGSSLFHLGGGHKRRTSTPWPPTGSRSFAR